LSQITRLTDRQTDGRTEFSSLDRVCISCSAVKMRSMELLSPLHISGTVGARNVKFGRQIHYQRYWRKKCKIVLKGREGVTWPTFEILGPPPHLGNSWSWKRQIWQADWPPGALP